MKPQQRTIPQKPAKPNSRCLICGEKCAYDSDTRINCTMQDCGYGTHETCAAVLSQANQKKLNCQNFKCNDVTHYLKPHEVAEHSTDRMAGLRAVLKQRKVNVNSYTPKRKRYLNPDSQCPRCGQTISINEVEHDLRYCGASTLGTPVPSRDYIYVKSKMKRLRKQALHDYPP